MISARTFSVTAWKRPGVEATCLELQNVHGQCPALLLWRCWALEENLALEPEHLAMAVAIARGWDGDVLRPLRAIRERLARVPKSGNRFSDQNARQTKNLERRSDSVRSQHALAAPVATVGDAARATLRRRILEAELEAEHALLDALEALATPGVASGEIAPLQAITDLAEAWRPPAPAAALARLNRALWQAL